MLICFDKLFFQTKSYQPPMPDLSMLNLKDINPQVRDLSKVNFKNYQRKKINFM
jgi:hypothetical protein